MNRMNNLPFQGLSFQVLSFLQKLKLTRLFWVAKLGNHLSDYDCADLPDILCWDVALVERKLASFHSCRY
eukprot:3462346-Amphidinium_carterae.1